LPPAAPSEGINTPQPPDALDLAEPSLGFGSGPAGQEVCLESAMSKLDQKAG